MKFDYKSIEPKWQARWEEAHAFEAKDGSGKPKFYGLVEFPYPSGAGMHVGHIKAYGGLEVVSRKRRMQGYNVLFPIGFDAYGLPTENYAIKTGIHPPPGDGHQHSKVHLAAEARWLRLRLVSRDRHHRGGLLSLDAVHLPQALRKGLCLP